MTLTERKRQFMTTLTHLERADARLIDCVKAAKEKVNAAKSAQRLARIDRQTSDEIERIMNQKQ